jgi:hypothetical protein
MVKTNRFDGFRFSFIQIARLLKRIFLLVVGYLKPHSSPCPQLLGHSISF